MVRARSFSRVAAFAAAALSIYLLEGVWLVHSPAFAAHAGQFYDRASFDALAREVGALYRTRDPAAADDFRARLDHRLAERARPPVAWDRAA